MRRPKRTPRAWNRFGHFLPYHLGNDLRALDLCVRLGLKRIDIDALISKDGIFVGTHWDLPLRHGFKDPLGRTMPDRRVNTMSYKHLRRLVADGCHIWSLWVLFREAARRDLTVEVDLKLDRRWEDVKVMRRLKATADKLGCSIVVKTTSDLPGASRRLRAAKAAGITTIVLPRGDKRLSKAVWWPVADYVRGPVRWVA